MSALTRNALRAAAACAVLTLSACGSTSTLDAASAAPLHERVAAVRAAVANGENSTAREALAAFGEDVERLTASGALDSEDADVLLAHAAALESAIPAQVPAATPVLPEQAGTRVLVPPVVELPATSGGTAGAPTVDDAPAAPVATTAPERRDAGRDVEGENGAPGRGNQSPPSTAPRPPVEEAPEEQPPAEEPPTTEQPPDVDPPTDPEPEEEPPAEEPPADPGPVDTPDDEAGTDD